MRVVSSPNAWAIGPPATAKPTKVSPPTAVSAKVAEALGRGIASTTESIRFGLVAARVSCDMARAGLWLGARARALALRMVQIANLP